MNINKTLQQKVNDLLSQISVGNKVRFGSKSQKGIKKNAPVQDRDKDKDGVMRKGYFPKAEESAEIDRIPGTHASCSLLANLVFNKYHMNTPVYREMVRLLNNKMNVSRNTVYNWFVKGSEYLNKVFPILKEMLLAKGAVVNCDETWCRVKVAGKYGKKYIWCMVNKEAKTAVYFYDDGSRGRKVLREFLDKTEIDALQSDGFRSSLSRLLPTGRKNVYMYLDKELVDRTLRPMTVERKRSICDRLLPTGRKNSLTFGSHAGAKVSVIYHTFIETCKMCGVSTLEYFKEFFKAIMQGRTDYERSALPLSSSVATERICYR